MSTLIVQNRHIDIYVLPISCNGSLTIFQKAVVDKTVMMAKQASTVVGTLRTSVPSMSTPFTNSNAADLNLSSDFSKALGVNEEQFEEMFEEENGTVPPKTVPQGKKPPSDTILKDILENTKTNKSADPVVKPEPVEKIVSQEPVKKLAKKAIRPPLSAFKAAPKVVNISV